MKMNKKAVEMTLSTVIVAIILLIVLGVVIFIFVKGMGQGKGAMDGYFDKVTIDENDPAKDSLNDVGGSIFENSIIPIAPLILFFRKKRVEV